MEVVQKNENLSASLLLKLKIRKEIDLKMSLKFEKEKPKAKLPINEDTCYDIFYDIYDSGQTKYLYIRMQENTARAPFFYNRSYELQDLYSNHRIFKTCDTMEEINVYLHSLFQKNKVNLRFNEEDNEEIIIMEMNAILFATPFKLQFELYREMVPEIEKDPKLLELYKLNKMKLKSLKEIYAFIENNKDEITQKLKKLFKKYEIPGLE